MRMRTLPNALRFLAAASSAAPLLCLFALASCGAEEAQSSGPAAADDVSGGKDGLVGNPAPNFSTKAVNSKETVSLKRLRGHVVLVDFWGTFCEPCKKSFPKLEELSERYADQGFRIVGVSEDEAEDKDKIPDFAGSLGAKFTLAWDEDKSIARAYKPETMPSSYLIDKKGIVRYAHVGYHNGEELQVDKEIKELLEK